MTSTEVPGDWRDRWPRGRWVKGGDMPIWWVGLVGIVGLITGFLFNVGWLKFFGVLSLVGAAVGLLLAMIRLRA